MKIPTPRRRSPNYSQRDDDHRHHRAAMPFIPDSGQETPFPLLLIYRNRCQGFIVLSASLFAERQSRRPLRRGAAFPDRRWLMASWRSQTRCHDWRPWFVEDVVFTAALFMLTKERICRWHNLTDCHLKRVGGRKYFGAGALSGVYDR